MSACESVRERGVKILNKEENEGMRKVCRVRQEREGGEKHKMGSEEELY